nr:glycoside hydrolase family 13 protein [uncultured Draconibacterium sp.]
MQHKIFQVVFIILVLSVKGYSQVEIDKIEPLCWWVGMNNPELQLMVSGENISEATPVITYDGVEVTAVHRGDSPNYLFIDLMISEKTKAGDLNILFKTENKDINYSYSLKQRNPESTEREGFSSKDVMYLLMPDRFANGDISNDETTKTIEGIDRKDEFGRHGGDIQGIIDHLDYINDLGVTCVWSTPVLENNNELGSYHGFAITDFYNVDPRFGNNEKYKEMVDSCHANNLKVVMDMVLNHCGRRHPWTIDPPFKDWLHFKEMEEQYYHNKRAFNDPHASKSDLDLVLNGTFDVWVPDLNQKNPFLLKYFIQNSIWWIEYSGINGIRMDTYMYNDHQASAIWAKAVMEEYPNYNIVGENWLFETHQVAYWQDNTINPTGYKSNLKTVMDFPLYYAIQNCFNEEDFIPKDGHETGIKRLYNILANDYLYADLNNILVFSENHDTPRMNHVIDGDLNKFKMIMTFLATTRGIPQLYYGSEVMMKGDKSKGDGDIRRDYPGGWTTDNRNLFLQENRNEQENESYNFLKKLLHWRKEKEVIHTGKLVHYVPQNGVYVYFRMNEDDAVMVVLNNNNSSVNLETARFRSELNGISSGFEVLCSKKVDDLSKIDIKGKSAMIIELK